MEKSILIVDDSRISRVMVRRVISNLPGEYTIREAEGGGAAISLYQEMRADLVLLDLTMEGGMDGFATLEKLKEIDPAAQVIIVSADIQTKARERIMALGALGFIGKPFNKEQLLTLANNALRHDE